MNSKNLERLPEEIRSYILSLMPTKFAVQTSILCKSWRYSWTSITNLDFDDTHSSSTHDSLTKFVNRVFKSYKTSKINLFRLHLDNRGVEQLNLSNWIDEAVKLNVRELDIRTSNLHDLPLSSMFTCSTLTMLRLDDAGNGSIWVCPLGVSLPCLKTLDIIVHSNPFDNAFKLIPGCPVLESLSLKLELWKAEEHYIFNIPTLKSLKLTMKHWKHDVFHKVVLCLPVLESICVGGYLSSLFVMEDLSALVEASISTYSVSTDHVFLQLLKGISGAKSLSIQDMLYDVPLPIFPNMKHLELKLYWDYGVIPRFLECCPELKHLCLGMHYSICIWKEPKAVPGCIRTKLTTLKYTSRKETARYDTKFLKYVLGIAEVLKTVTISCEQLSVEEEIQLYAELINFPRASIDCDFAVKTGSWLASLK